MNIYRRLERSRKHLHRLAQSMSASAEIDRLRARVAKLETALEACHPIIKHRVVDGSEEAEAALEMIEEALTPQTPRPAIHAAGDNRALGNPDKPSQSDPSPGQLQGRPNMVQ